MDAGTPVQVVGKGGLRGVIRNLPQSGNAEVELDTGQRLDIPVSLLQKNPNGTYRIPLSLDDISRVRPGSQTDVASALDTGQSVTVPVVQEQLHLTKEKHETGRIVVRIVPQVRTEHIHMPLAEEHVQVDRIPVNRFVTTAQPIREEGDTTIIPVYDEVLVVERRLLLREEVRIRRQRITRAEERDIRLRTEEVQILRSEPPPHESPPAAAT